MCRRAGAGVRVGVVGEDGKRATGDTSRPLVLDLGRAGLGLWLWAWAGLQKMGGRNGEEPQTAKGLPSGGAALPLGRAPLGEWVDGGRLSEHPGTCVHPLQTQVR